MVSGPMTDDVDLYELCGILWAGRKLVLSFFLVCMALACVFIFVVSTPKYKSVAVIRATDLSQTVVEAYLQSSDFKREVGNTIGRGVAVSSSVDRRSKLITLSMESQEKENVSEYLQKSLTILSEYMNTKYVTDAQSQIKVFEQNTDPSQCRFVELRVKQEGGETSDVQRSFSILTDRLSELRAEDALARKFDVISTPSIPGAPFKPKRILILGATAFGSLFIGILAVFVRSAVRRARAQRQSVAA
jgi:LPS O-antigen subunit length determinant protein (WzzB/FepE family)